MPHPLPATLETPVRSGLAGLPVSPPFEAQNLGARALSGLPSAAGPLGNLVYAHSRAWAWLLACAEVVGLEVTPRPGGSSFAVTLSKSGVVALLVFEQNKAVGFAVASFLGLDPQTRHDFDSRLSPRNYRVYAVAADELRVDEDFPVSILGCDTEVTDITDPQISGNRLTFQVSLSSPGRLAAVLVPRVNSGAVEGLAGWLSPGEALVHPVSLSAPAGEWRAVVFGSSAFRPV